MPCKIKSKLIEKKYSLHETRNMKKKNYEFKIKEYISKYKCQKINISMPYVYKKNI